MNAKWIFINYVCVLIILSGLLILWFSKQPAPFIDKTQSAEHREKIAKLDQIDPVVFQAFERKILGVPSVKITPISREEMNRPVEGAIYKSQTELPNEDKSTNSDVCTQENSSDACKWVPLQ